MTSKQSHNVLSTNRLWFSVTGAHSCKPDYLIWCLHYKSNYAIIVQCLISTISMARVCVKTWLKDFHIFAQLISLSIFLGRKKSCKKTTFFSNHNKLVMLHSNNDTLCVTQFNSTRTNLESRAGWTNTVLVNNKLLFY